MTNISQDLGSLIYLSNGNFANLTHQKKDIKTSKNNNQQTNVPDVDTLIPRFWDAHAFSCWANTAQVLTPKLQRLNLSKCTLAAPKTSLGGP